MQKVKRKRYPSRLYVRCSLNSLLIALSGVWYPVFVFSFTDAGRREHYLNLRTDLRWSDGALLSVVHRLYTYVALVPVARATATPTHPGPSPTTSSTGKVSVLRRVTEMRFISTYDVLRSVFLTTNYDFRGWCRRRRLRGCHLRRLRLYHGFQA